MLLVIVLTACNGDDKDNDDENPPDAQNLITEASTNLDEAKSYQLEIRQEGEPTVITDSPFLITFQNAQAVYSSPNRVRAKVSVGIEDVTQEVLVTVIEDRQYVNHALLTGSQWQPMEFAPGFRANDLQSETNGIGNALLTIVEPEYVGTAEVSGGVKAYHIHGKVSAAKIKSVTVGLMASEEGDIDIDIYLRQSDKRVAQIILHEPTTTGEFKTWTIDFAAYNQSFDIQEPEVSS
jgi:hypothetical protein